MYFLEDGTDKCGFYECKKCNYRFLSLATEKKTECPLCAQYVDYEIGPDESLGDLLETSELIEIVEGEENVARMDALLSVAYAEDDSWI